MAFAAAVTGANSRQLCEPFPGTLSAVGLWVRLAELLVHPYAPFPDVFAFLGIPQGRCHENTDLEPHMERMEAACHPQVASCLQRHMPDLRKEPSH